MKSSSDSRYYTLIVKSLHGDGGSEHEAVTAFCRSLRRVGYNEPIHPTMLKGICRLPASITPEMIAREIANALTTNKQRNDELYNLGVQHFTNIRPLNLNEDYTLEQCQLSDLLYLLRRKKGLSQETLKRETSIADSVPSIQSYEDGSALPEMPVLRRVLERLEASPKVTKYALLLHKQAHGYSTAPLAEQSLGQIIRNSRLDAELTITELATRAGCSEGAIRKYEEGKTVPSTLPALKSILDALPLSPPQQEAVTAKWKATALNYPQTPLEYMSFKDTCRLIGMHSERSTATLEKLMGYRRDALMDHTTKCTREPIHAARYALWHNADMQEIAHMREAWVRHHLATPKRKDNPLPHTREGLEEKFDTAWKQAGIEMESLDVSDVPATSVQGKKSTLSKLSKMDATLSRRA